MPEEEKIVTVPFFIHEAVCDKLERAHTASLEASKDALDKITLCNRRMLMALVVVCAALIITVFGFLHAYTNMNDTWINYYDNHSEVVQNGEFVQGATACDQTASEG